MCISWFCTGSDDRGLMILRYFGFVWQLIHLLTRASFQLFLGDGQKIFQCHRTIEKLEKNSTLYVVIWRYSVPFFIYFFLFFFFFFLFSFFLSFLFFLCGGRGGGATASQPPSNDAPVAHCCKKWELLSAVIQFRCVQSCFERSCSFQWRSNVSIYIPIIFNVSTIFTPICLINTTASRQSNTQSTFESSCWPGRAAGSQKSGQNRGMFFSRILAFQRSTPL